MVKLICAVVGHIYIEKIIDMLNVFKVCSKLTLKATE